MYLSQVRAVSPVNAAQPGSCIFFTRLHSFCCHLFHKWFRIIRGMNQDLSKRKDTYFDYKFRIPVYDSESGFHQNSLKYIFYPVSKSFTIIILKCICFFFFFQWCQPQSLSRTILRKPRRIPGSPHVQIKWRRKSDQSHSKNRFPVNISSLLPNSQKQRLEKLAKKTIYEDSWRGGRLSWQKIPRNKEVSSSKPHN